MSRLRPEEDSPVRSVRLEADALHVTLAARISVNQALAMRQQLFELVRRYQPQRLVLEMAQVVDMDSSAIGVLVEVRRQLGTEGVMELHHLFGPVRGLVRILRLESLFILVGDPETNS